MRRLILALCLTACAPYATLTRSTDISSDATIVPVFTITNRAISEDGALTARGEDLHYARLDIAVPSDRQPGEISVPGRSIDRRTDFLLADSAAVSREDFRRRLSAALRPLPPSERDVLIYVHGFNNGFADGVLRMAQLIHDIALDGVAVHFSWPSNANPLAYMRDRGSALFSRDALVETLELINVPEARRVGIIAHSMGAFLTMEALRQMELVRPGRVSQVIDGVVFLSPDIDVDVFRSQARRIKTLPQPFVIFLSERDRALGLSARLTGESARLGNLQDANEIGAFDVTLVNVSEFSAGTGHFDVGTSPALIGIVAQAAEIDNAFAGDTAGISGLLPGSVLTIRNVTQFILSPGG